MRSRSENEVSTTTRASSAGLARSRGSPPRRPCAGISRSMSTTSGSVLGARARPPRAPSAAAPTTSMSAAPRQQLRQAVAHHGWSSASSDPDHRAGTSMRTRVPAPGLGMDRQLAARVGRRGRRACAGRSGAGASSSSPGAKPRPSSSTRSVAVAVHALEACTSTCVGVGVAARRCAAPPGRRGRAAPRVLGPAARGRRRRRSVDRDVAGAQRATQVGSAAGRPGCWSVGG